MFFSHVEYGGTLFFSFNWMKNANLVDFYYVTSVSTHRVFLSDVSYKLYKLQVCSSHPKKTRCLETTLIKKVT